MDDPEDNDVTTLGGSVEEIAGNLMMRIPLEAGGDHFIDCSRGIGQVVGSELQVIIPVWLAEKLGIIAGTEVVVDNRNGKFNIYPQHGESN